MVLSVVLAGAVPATASRPHFVQSEPTPTAEHPAATLKLLQGDGVVFSDPVRAVVVDGDGRLLAVSPVVRALKIVCEGTQRRCVAYDELTRTVYQPRESDWRDGGLIDMDGVPQAYPEDMTAEFGFAARPATIAEVLRFELVGILTSWWTTGAALAWWTSFWLLLLPVSRFFLRRGGPLTIGTLVTLLLRTAGALMMIPLTAYAWLLAPYSLLYLAIVVGVSGAAALAMTIRRSPHGEARSAH